MAYFLNSGQLNSGTLNGSGAVPVPASGTATETALQRATGMVPVTNPPGVASLNL